MAFNIAPAQPMRPLPTPAVPNLMASGAAIAAIISRTMAQRVQNQRYKEAKDAEKAFGKFLGDEKNYDTSEIKLADHPESKMGKILRANDFDLEKSYWQFGSMYKDHYGSPQAALAEAERQMRPREHRRFKEEKLGEFRELVAPLNEGKARFLISSIANGASWSHEDQWSGISDELTSSEKPIRDYEKTIASTYAELEAKQKAHQKITEEQGSISRLLGGMEMESVKGPGYLLSNQETQRFIEAGIESQVLPKEAFSQEMSMEYLSMEDRAALVDRIMQSPEGAGMPRQEAERLVNNEVVGRGGSVGLGGVHADMNEMARRIAGQSQPSLPGGRKTGVDLSMATRDPSIPMKASELGLNASDYKDHFPNGVDPANAFTLMDAHWDEKTKTIKFNAPPSWNTKGEIDDLANKINSSRKKWSSKAALRGVKDLSDAAAMDLEARLGGGGGGGGGGPLTGIDADAADAFGSAESSGDLMPQPAKPQDRKETLSEYRRRTAYEGR